MLLIIYDIVERMMTEYFWNKLFNISNLFSKFSTKNFEFDLLMISNLSSKCSTKRFEFKLLMFSDLFSKCSQKTSTLPVGEEQFDNRIKFCVRKVVCLRLENQEENFKLL